MKKNQLFLKFWQWYCLLSLWLKEHMICIFLNLTQADFVWSVHLNHCKLSSSLASIWFCTFHILFSCFFFFNFESQKSFKCYKLEPSTNEGPFDSPFLCFLASFSCLLTKADVVLFSNNWFIFLKFLSWLIKVSCSCWTAHKCLLFYSAFMCTIYPKPVSTLIEPFACLHLPN